MDKDAILATLMVLVFVLLGAVLGASLQHAFGGPRKVYIIVQPPLNAKDLQSLKVFGTEEAMWRHAFNLKSGFSHFEAEVPVEK
jgi:hypothetical protein